MSALRRPAKVMRDVVRDATAGPRARHEETKRRERTLAPSPGSAVRAVGYGSRVHASERIRSGLAGQWLLTDDNPDAVLIEADARSAVTLEAPFAQQRAAVLAATVPVIVWITGSARIAPEPVGRLVDSASAPVHIFVDDEGSIPGWATGLGREVRLLAPAADTDIHSPAVVGATSRREQVIALVGEAGLDTARLSPIQPQRLEVFGGDDAASEIPGDRPTLGRYRAAAIVTDRPVSAWLALEAGAAATALMATRETVERLPDPVAAEVTRIDDDTQLALQARAHLWQDELVERAGMRTARAVRDGHSYAHRAADLEALLGDPAHDARRVGLPSIGG